MTTPPESERSGAQSIERALSILRLLAHRPIDGLSIKTIAAATNLHVSTASRMARVMMQLGYIEQSPGNRRYRLGFGASVVGAAVAQRLKVSLEVRLLVDKLADALGDSVYFCVRQGASAVFVYRAQGSFPIRTVTVEKGSHVPLGIGAAGLAILLSLQPEARKKILRMIAPVVSSYGLSMADIEELSAMAEKQGFTLMDGRTFPGIHSVGVAVPTNRQHLQAGLSVSSIPERVSPVRQLEIAQELKRVAALISQLEYFREIHPLASHRPSGVEFW